MNDDTKIEHTFKIKNNFKSKISRSKNKVSIKRDNR